MSFKGAVVVLALLLVVVVEGAYRLDSNFTGAGFFDNFNFFTDNDPTHGYVNFLNENDAKSKGLISANGNKVIIASDSTHVASGRGRDSIRLVSKKTWNSGLFVMDLINMPTGCGTWPAWWLVGPNWPNAGEIDIIEGVNKQVADQTTLHTSANCKMDPASSSQFTGKWGTGANNNPAIDCYINAPNEYNNQGCGIVAADGTYGEPFNNGQGGVYALEWTSSAIKAWFWKRNNIPSDIHNPNPSNWGKPYAYFALGSNCAANHFNTMNMVFDLTFCGDWAGAVFDQMCPNMGDCNNYVKNNPGAFKSAFWQVQYVNVWAQ